MKSRISSILGKLKKKKVFIPLIVILVIILWNSFGSSGGAGVEKIAIKSETFVQEVSVTGKVVAAKNVDMAFEASGRVAEIRAKVGGSVSQGDLLASLSNGDAWGVVLQKQARVDEESAQLAEVQKGTRQEDIHIAKSEAEGAQSSYSQAVQSLIDQIKDSYSKSDDSLRSKIDQLYSNPRSVTPEIMSFDNYQLKRSLEDQRVKVGEVLVAWNIQLNTVSGTSSYSDAILKDARNNLSVMRAFLNDLSVAASSFKESGSFTQVTIDKYRSDISSARTSISSAISALTSVELTYKNAVTTKQTKEEQYKLKLAGSTEEQIAAQQAQYKSALADLQGAQSLYGKTLIRAPFDGLVTKVDIKEGQTVSPTTNAISMISSAGYEIESFVSESDIAKVKVGQPAVVTLDAYGKDTKFKATVSEVDPAETVLDGVSTYKTKLQFVVNDERIRSGMTANTKIQTAEKPVSVVIPQEALFLEGGEKVVTIEEGGKRVNKKVITGGINSDGNIEVISGLSIGDVVVMIKK
jgi:HlyD family secretion protein